MTVPATIPAIEVVHRTSLTLNDDFVKQVMADRYIVVGQALSAELRITHTRKWGSQVLDRELQCCFDVQADPDSWLIGGMRRCYFMAKVSTQGYYAGDQLFTDAHHTSRTTTSSHSHFYSSRNEVDIWYCLPSRSGQFKPIRRRQPHLPARPKLDRCHAKRTIRRRRKRSWLSPTSAARPCASTRARLVMLLGSSNRRRGGYDRRPFNAHVTEAYQ